MEDNSILGVKELYDVVLKAYTDTEINGVKVKEGQVIGRFDKIQIARLKEDKSYIAARGGFGNRELVVWDDTESIEITFTQGVFSKTQLSILLNAHMATKEAPSEQLVPYYEEDESNEEGKFTLSAIPERKGLFLYNKKTGEQITDYVVEGKEITINEPYVEVISDYYSKYQDKSYEIKIGTPLTNGFLRLEGRTRLKDDNTGETVTGILTIPRLKLKSGLSMQLGQAASPAVGTFYGEGYPTGKRGHKVVSSLLILSQDIDEDL